MKSDLEKIIKPVEERDYPELSELASLNYGVTDISSPEYIRWEYGSNPAGEAIGCLAQMDSVLAGQYIVLPRDFMISNQIVKGSLSVNSLTHPQFRGRGLFTELAESTYELCKRFDCHFTIGIPNPVSAPLFLGKLNFRTPGTIPTLLLPLRPMSVIRKLLSGKKEKHGTDLDFIPDVSSANSFPEGDFLTGKGVLNENLFYPFVEEWSRKYKVCTYRNLSYMRWRYTDIPGRKYHFYAIRKEDSLLAFAVIRVKEVFAMNSMMLMEFMLSDKPDAIAAGRKLLRFLKVSARKSGVDLMLGAMTSGQEQKMLKSSGFLKLPDFILPQKLPLIVRIHNDFPSSKDLFQLRNWFFSMGDYDVF